MLHPVKSTLIHGLEVLVMGLIVAGLLYFFKDDQDIREAVKGLLAVVLTSAATMVPKYMRASDSIPVNDYVNNQ